MAPNLDPGVRIQALTLLQLGYTPEWVHDYLGVGISSIYRFARIAKGRGYDLRIHRLIKLEYVADAPRGGRPQKSTPIVNSTIVSTVERNSTTRAYTAQQIAIKLLETNNIQISERTVTRILRRLKYHKVKTTKKPGLTKAAKEARRAFCEKYKDWTLEEWKRVIWSDETSVVLGSRRGGERIWRTSKQKNNIHCIRHRWKGAKEFMFWGCFSYDKKGPFHIWKDETKVQKKAYEKDLIERNELIEPENRRNWELNNGVRRLRIDRNNPGRKPVWKHTKVNGAILRTKGKGGIDWYRYQQEVLKPKLIPFAKECMKERPDTLVQEDNASPYAAGLQQEVFNLAGVIRLLWPGNSPDLNAIEPCWYWMKRVITKHGKLTSRLQASIAWTKCWEKDLTQKMIRRWIRRIIRHIRLILSPEINGGNEYTEGNYKKADAEYIDYSEEEDQEWEESNE
jgi:transposase